MALNLYIQSGNRAAIVPEEHSRGEHIMVNVQVRVSKVGKFMVGMAIGGALFLGAHGVGWAAEPAPQGMKPLATCADGKTEYSATGDHRGACSGHGGVARWADGSPVKSHKPKTTYR